MARSPPLSTDALDASTTSAAARASPCGMCSARSTGWLGRSASHTPRPSVVTRGTPQRTSRARLPSLAFGLGTTSRRVCAPSFAGNSKPVSSSVLTSQRGAIQRPEDDVKHPATNMRGFGATALRVSALTLATQLIGFGSSIAVARVLGATSATDAYYLGLSVPMLVYGIFLTTSRQCAIPALTDEAGASRSSF